jgi:hypothetical protein
LELFSLFFFLLFFCDLSLKMQRSLGLVAWRREGVALLSITAAVACFVLAAQPYVAGGHIGLMSVLGINLGFFSELRVGDYAPGFPEGGDVQWLNSKVLWKIFSLNVLSLPLPLLTQMHMTATMRLLLAVVLSAMRR